MHRPRPPQMRANSLAQGNIAGCETVVELRDGRATCTEQQDPIPLREGKVLDLTAIGKVKRKRGLTTQVNSSARLRCQRAELCQLQRSRSARGHVLDTTQASRHIGSRAASSVHEAFCQKLLVS